MPIKLCKFHCRCMNLDGKCPNPHYLDSNCTCPRPEQPHTSKEEEIVEEFKKRFCYQSTGIVTGFKYGFRTGDFKAEKVIDFILQIRQQALTDFITHKREQLTKE